MQFFTQKDRREEVKEFESKSQMILGVAILLWNLALVFFCGTLLYQLIFNYIIALTEGKSNLLVVLGVLLILLVFFMVFFFLVLKLISAFYWFNFLEISKKHIYTYLYPFLSQKIKIEEIASIDIYWQQTYLFFRKIALPKAIKQALYTNGRFENFECFKLKINKIKGKSIFLKYAINNLEEAEEIKEYILNPKALKKERIIEQKYQVIETKYNISFFSEQLFFRGQILFFVGLFLLISWLTLLQIEQNLPILSYLLYMLMGVVVLTQLYIIIAHTKIKKVEITKFHIKEHQVGLPFKNRFFVKKEEIELLDLAQRDTEYKIRVVTQKGVVHDLPIGFRTRAEGEEQLMKIKKVLKIT